MLSFISPRKSFSSGPPKTLPSSSLHSPTISQVKAPPLLRAIMTLPFSYPETAFTASVGVGVGASVGEGDGLDVTVGVGTGFSVGVGAGFSVGDTVEVTDASCVGVVSLIALLSSFLSDGAASSFFPHAAMDKVNNSRINNAKYFFIWSYPSCFTFSVNDVQSD